MSDPTEPRLQKKRLTDVLADIRSREPTNGALLVGVDGRSGSGKSTLARHLAALGDATVVELDDFLSWGDLDSWWPRFEEEVLDPLSHGQDARYRIRDWENDEFGKSLNGWKTSPWSDLIIIEGVTSTRVAADERLAYRIWVAAPPTVRLARGLRRDGESHRQLWLDWMVLEDEFFARDRARERADLVVCGSPAVLQDSAAEVIVDCTPTALE